MFFINFISPLSLPCSQLSEFGDTIRGWTGSRWVCGICIPTYTSTSWSTISWGHTASVQVAETIWESGWSQASPQAPVLHRSNQAPLCSPGMLIRGLGGPQKQRQVKSTLEKGKGMQRKIRCAPVSQAPTPTHECKQTCIMRFTHLPATASICQQRTPQWRHTTFALGTDIRNDE